MPKVIGGYTFHKNIHTGMNSPFQIGIYKSHDGKLALAKIWQGKVKNLRYFALLNEITFYKAFSNKVNPVRESVSFPAYVDSRIDSNKLILLTEFVEGRYSTSLYHYDQCVEFMQFLGNNLSSKEKKSIPKKSALYFLTLFPIILLVAFLKHPELILRLLAGAYVFLRGMPTLVKDKSNILIHGDLHTKNILAKNNYLKIIDLEQVCFTFPEYELVSTLMCRSINKILFKTLSIRLTKSSLENRTSRLKYTALLANCSIHYLTGTNSRAKVNLFSQMLKLATTL